MQKLLVACFSLGGAILAATSAQAACTQQFVNTTCDWLGRNCKNNFKSVCTPDKVTVAPAVKTGGVPLGTSVATTPLIVAKPGASLISQDGGTFKPGANVISNDGGSLRSGGNLVGNAGGTLVGNAGGTLVGNAGGTLRNNR